MAVSIKIIDDGNLNEQEKEFYNVAHEMKIASSLPFMPKLYVMNSNIPNAFAFGWSEQSSAVVVTSKLMDMLNRDELQGWLLMSLLI